jgi:hypothetical protein
MTDVVGDETKTASRESHVVQVQGHHLGYAGAGVERDQGQGLVPGRGTGVDRPQEADLSPGGEGTGGGVGDVDPHGPGRTEASTGVEVVDGGQSVVHRGGLGLGHGLEMAAVVAHGPVPGLGARQRVAVGLGASQPSQVLAGLGGIGAPGLV